MPARRVAFLRAVNVGGRRVKMADVCRLFESKPLAMSNVRSFLASGNIVFETTPARARDPRTLTRKIETQLEQNLGYRVDVFLRTLEQVASIGKYQAFKPDALKRAQALNVLLLAQPLGSSQSRELNTLKTSIDDFHLSADTGCEVYWMCSLKQSESDFSNALFEKRIGVRSTARTIRTFQRLAAQYNAAP